MTNTSITKSYYLVIACKGDVHRDRRTGQRYEKEKHSYIDPTIKQ
jgi:hypothetical protein